MRNRWQLRAAGRSRFQGVNPAWVPHRMAEALIWAFDSTTVSNGTVPAVINPVAPGFATFPNFQRSTLASPGDRPTKGATGMVFDGTTDIHDESAGYTYRETFALPDPAYAQAGKGPTCAGLARRADGTWLIGNYGKLNESTAGGETFQGGYLHLSADFRTIIKEVKNTDLGLTAGGSQGIVEDTDGTIYLADTQNGRVYHISADGSTVLHNYAVANVNGITINTLTGELLTCQADSATITRRTKTTGASLGTFTIRDITNSTLDHLHFVPGWGSAGALLTSCRDNGTNGRVVMYDVASGYTPIRSWSLQNIKAVEGIVVVGNVLYVADDEYYHNQPDAVNSVKSFDIEALPLNTGTRLTLCLVLTSAGTPGSTVCVLQGGDAVTTGGPIRTGLGLYLVNVANTLRCIVTIGGNQIVFDWVVTNLTAETLYTLDLDTVAHTAALYENGAATPVGGAAQSNANLTGTLLPFAFSLGADYENAAIAVRFGASTQAIGCAARGAAYRAQQEGWCSWQWKGDGSLLAVGHTYKNARP